MDAITVILIVIASIGTLVFLGLIVYALSSKRGKKKYIQKPIKVKDSQENKGSQDAVVVSKTQNTKGNLVTLSVKESSKINIGQIIQMPADRINEKSDVKKSIKMQLLDEILNELAEKKFYTEMHKKHIPEIENIQSKQKKEHSIPKVKKRHPRKAKKRKVRICSKCGTSRQTASKEKPYVCFKCKEELKMVKKK